MGKIIKKLTKYAVKGVVIAGISKLGVMILRKANKDGALEEKAHHAIDVQGEKAKELAKTGVSKTISAAQNLAEDEDEEVSAKS